MTQLAEPAFMLAWAAQSSKGFDFTAGPERWILQMEVDPRFHHFQTSIDPLAVSSSATA